MASDEYTEQDRHNEGCCWTWQRDQCMGDGCLCVCHTSGEPERGTYFDLVNEVEGYRQRTRDEDTARIRLNHARIEAEDKNARLTALLAERDAEIARLVAERDALRARAERAELANTAGRRYLDAADKMYALRAWDGNGKVMRLWGEWRAALAAASEGEGQG